MTQPQNHTKMPEKRNLDDSNDIGKIGTGKRIRLENINLQGALSDEESQKQHMENLKSTITVLRCRLKGFEEVNQNCAKILEEKTSRYSAMISYLTERNIELSEKNKALQKELEEWKKKYFLQRTHVKQTSSQLFDIIQRVNNSFEEKSQNDSSDTLSIGNRSEEKDSTVIVIDSNPASEEGNETQNFIRETAVLALEEMVHSGDKDENSTENNDELKNRTKIYDRMCKTYYTNSRSSGRRFMSWKREDILHVLLKVFQVYHIPNFGPLVTYAALNSWMNNRVPDTKKRKKIRDYIVDNLKEAALKKN
jgi:hypothetical protein